MTTTLKVLIQPKLAEVDATSQYTSQGCTTTIDKFTATNTSASNHTLYVHLVPSGGTAGPTNAITKTIAPGQTWSFPEVVGHSLEAGDSIWTDATTGGVIAIRASGRQFT